MPEKTKIAEELDKLARLQEVDSDVFHLKAKKRSLPSEKERIDQELESKKAAFQEAEEIFKQVTVAKNEKETEMQGLEEKILKHEGELFQIKNNKEYSALRQEIDSIKADVSVLEEEIIGLYDQIEQAKQSVNTEKKLFEDEKKEAEKEKNEISIVEKEVDNKLKEAGAKRQELAKDIDSEVLNLYQRILENRGEKALATVKDEFCGQCNMHLRPQVVNACKIKKKIVTCENCGRILYVRV